MRTLKLTIAYDGTRYAGWQVQKARRQTSARPPGPTRTKAGAGGDQARRAGDVRRQKTKAKKI